MYVYEEESLRQSTRKFCISENSVDSQTVAIDSRLSIATSFLILSGDFLVTSDYLGKLFQWPVSYLVGELIMS